MDSAFSHTHQSLPETSIDRVVKLSVSVLIDFLLTEMQLSCPVSSPVFLRFDIDFPAFFKYVQTTPARSAILKITPDFIMPVFKIASRMPWKGVPILIHIVSKVALCCVLSPMVSHHVCKESHFTSTLPDSHRIHGFHQRYDHQWSRRRCSGILPYRGLSSLWLPAFASRISDNGLSE